MRKIILTIALLAVVGGVSAAKKSPKKSNYKNATKLTTAIDSVSYLLGNEMGRYLDKMPVELDFEVFLMGIKEEVNGKSPYSQPDAYEILNTYFTVTLPAEQMKKAEAFLADVKRHNKNIQETESGLLYEIINEGSSARAFGDDEVRVTYKMSSMGGKATEDSGEEPVSMVASRTIHGFEEGIKLIGEGGSIKLWMHPNLAYGASGSNNISPNEVIMFEVQLHDIIEHIWDAADDSFDEVLEFDDIE